MARDSVTVHAYVLGVERPGISVVDPPLAAS